MQCIFCLTEKPSPEFNREHVFPESIGGSWVINSVCKACNSRLGTSIDAYLADNGLSKLVRHVQRIRNKSGAVPNPFGNAPLLGHPGTRVQWRLDNMGELLDLHVLPNVTRDPSKPFELQITIDVKDRAKLPGIIAKHYERAGFKPPSEAELNRMVQNAPVTRVEEPWLEQRLEINPMKVWLAMLKIAYEVTATWLGPSYLDDPVAASIRAALFDAETDDSFHTKHPLRGMVRAGTDEDGPLAPWNQESMSHIALLMPSNASNDALTCCVRVFDAFTCEVVVSESPERYPGFEGRFIAMDPTNGARRESSFLEEIGRLVTENEPENSPGR